MKLYQWRTVIFQSYTALSKYSALALVDFYYSIKVGHALTAHASTPRKQRKHRVQQTVPPLKTAPKAPTVTNCFSEIHIYPQSLKQLQLPSPARLFWIMPSHMSEELMWHSLLQPALPPIYMLPPHAPWSVHTHFSRCCLIKDPQMQAQLSTSDPGSRRVKPCSASGWWEYRDTCACRYGREREWDCLHVFLTCKHWHCSDKGKRAAFQNINV